MINPTQITASWQKPKLKCSCGQERNPSGLRQHLKTSRRHRRADEKGYRHGCFWSNGLRDKEVDRIVEQIREANTDERVLAARRDALRFRQATFEEMFES